MKEVRFYFSAQEYNKYIVDDSFDHDDLMTKSYRNTFLIPKDEHNANQIMINLEKVWFVAWVDNENKEFTRDAQNSNINEYL